MPVLLKTTSLLRVRGFECHTSQNIKWLMLVVKAQYLP